MKALLVTAAVGAVGIATSMADPVYSANVVGFVNVTIPSQYSVIANPLQATNGNPLSVVIPAIPGDLEGVKILKWNVANQAFDVEIEYFPGADVPGWYQNDVLSTATLNPGEGVFIYNGNASSFTLTFVGEVLQGTVSTTVPPAYSILGSKIPTGGSLTSLSFPEVEGMKYLHYNAANQNFDAETEYFPDADVPGWYQSDVLVNPTPGIGEGFFIYNGNVGGAQNWTTTFNVN